MPGQGKRRRRHEAESQRLAARTAPDAGRWEVIVETRDQAEMRTRLRRLRGWSRWGDDSDRHAVGAPGAADYLPAEPVGDGPPGGSPGPNTLTIDLEAGRGELTDAARERIEPLLPRVDGRGRPWRDHRQVIDGVLWRLRAGAPWRDVPGRYGPWQTVYERFAARWEADGTWAKLLEHVQVHDDAVGRVEWTICVDSTVNRAHQHAVGARRT